jgi:hypothetical protein
MFIGLVIATRVARADPRAGRGSTFTAVALVGIVALGLIGPYSCLPGALASDFSGVQGGAAASG